MNSVFNKLNESNKIIDSAIDRTKDDVYNTTYDLQNCFDIINNISEALNSKDRAPKKKIKPMLKELTKKLLDIDETIQKLSDNLHDNLEVETGFFVQETTETLELIDQLFADYKHYKKINITEFLDQLDKLIY